MVGAILRGLDRSPGCRRAALAVLIVAVAIVLVAVAGRIL